MSDAAPPEVSEPSQDDQNSPPGDSSNPDENNVRFECNICLDVPKDAVVSMCGHLFCWPCLHKWLETRPNRQNCPVCKSGLDASKVVPIYGRGSGGTDPRSKIPPRPRGQRVDDEYQYQGGGFQFPEPGHGGVQFSLGIGFFPFSFLNTIVYGNMNNHNDNQTDEPNAEQGSRQSQEEQLLSQVFLFLGIAVIFFLVFF